MLEGRHDDDDALAVLDHVAAAATENEQASHQLATRARTLRRRREEGRSWRTLLESEERPTMVELLSGALSRLLEAGSRLRRTQARVLHREGMTMGEIGELFGVSRQRVSQLLGFHRGMPRTPTVPDRAGDDASEPADGGFPA